MSSLSDIILDNLTEGQQKVYNICQEYPFLIPRDWEGNIDREYDYSYISLAIPQGWATLFFQMCADLKKVLVEEGYLDTFYFVDVKEKYNTLRCYPGHFETDKISQVLRKYEYLSQFICTRCGKPATKEITQGYIESLCDVCWESQRRRYDFRDIEFDTEFQISTFGISTGTITTVIDVSDEWNRY
jgi:hypothetical protein